MVRHILTYITNSVTEYSQQQGNIPRNVWMPCQGKAAMLFWVKLTCCLRERKISMKVQLDLHCAIPGWIMFSEQWVCCAVVWRWFSCTTPGFQAASPSTHNPTDQTSFSQSHCRAVPICFQQDYSTTQCASFHPFQSYYCACASLAVWLCNLGGNSDSKGVLLCHCVSGSHRNSLL